MVMKKRGGRHHYTFAAHTQHFTFAAHYTFSTYLLRLQALEPVLGLLLPEDDEGPAVLVKYQRHGCALKAAFFSSSKFLFFASFRWGLAGALCLCVWWGKGSGAAISTRRA